MTLTGNQFEVNDSWCGTTNRFTRICNVTSLIGKRKCHIKELLFHFPHHLCPDINITTDQNKCSITDNGNIGIMLNAKQ